MKKILTIIAVLATTGFCAAAQSKNFTVGKWIEIHGAVLKELGRNYVDSLPLDRMEKAGMDAMLDNLDPYTTFVPAEDNQDLQMLISKTYGGIGAIISKPSVDSAVVISEPYENSPAHKFNLECGDEILEIDSRSVFGLNAGECSSSMRGEAGTTVKFKVRKRYTGEIREIVVERAKVHLPDIDYAGMISDKTGYVSITAFTDNLGKEFRKTLASLKKGGMEKLVIDLRDNGGGLLSEAVEIVSCFVPKGTVVVKSIGRDKSQNYEYRTLSSPFDLKMPVIVLVNSSSASASEIVAGSLQDLDRAVIMGSRTFGKGLVQTIKSLPYGGQLKLTTAKYYTPSGRCVQAIDYSHRREDGSVAAVPDSLTHEFKTLHGRTVRDGGGITPDVILKEKNYSRLTYSLAAYGILDQYALNYVRSHTSIAHPSLFRLSDEEYENFISFASKREFDYRSSALAYFDKMKAELEKDALGANVKEELDALYTSLNMSKEAFLRLKKDEIVPLIEQEIATKAYYVRGGIEVRIRYDDELREALSKEYKL